MDSLGGEELVAGEDCELDQGDLEVGASSFGPRAELTGLFEGQATLRDQKILGAHESVLGLFLCGHHVESGDDEPQGSVAFGGFEHEVAVFGHQGAQVGQEPGLENSRDSV